MDPVNLVLLDARFVIQIQLVLIVWVNIILIKILPNVLCVFKDVLNASQPQSVNSVNLAFSNKPIMVYQLILVLNVHHHVYDANFQEVIAQFAMLVMSLLLEEFVLNVKLVV